MTRATNGWMVCGRNICLYSDTPRPGRRGLLRCIKHGEILGYESSLTGLSESEARKRWASVRAKAKGK